jgi:BirA family biotin operon repressor/biotin-[acetyl-CoA-carboxylase] ligase
MNQNELTKTLSGLSMGKIRYFDSIGSTNDEALAWAANDAPDLSLVLADEQTAGRGRLNRKWFTPKGTALAFSLILHPKKDEKPHLSRIVGLAALSVANAIGMLGLVTQIKWPNDVLLDRLKVAGILVESVWSGDEAESVIIGMGVNVSKDAIPSTDILSFPAISLEHALGEIPDRTKLLRNIISSLISLRPHMRTESFIAEWEKKLAYHNQVVHVETGDNIITGRVTGLESDGSLRLQDESGKSVTVHFGDVRLRPLT